MLTLILIGVLCIVFNIGDSVSTHYALNHLPDNLKAKESNPFAASIMNNVTIPQQHVQNQTSFLSDSLEPP